MTNSLYTETVDERELRLFQILERELEWRFQEIQTISEMISRDDLNRDVVSRAATVLLYAHWEGYVKRAIQEYVRFVSKSIENQCSLAPGLLLLYCQPIFGKIRSKSQDFPTQASLCAEIVNFSHNYDSKILSGFNADTKSNLRFEVFESFCATIGIDSAEFEPYKNFINKILCDRRNSVAHGEEMRLNLEDFNENANRMKMIIDHFTSSLTRCVSSRAYLVPVASQMAGINSSQAG